jgi:hypothetical protein
MLTNVALHLKPNAQRFHDLCFPREAGHHTRGDEAKESAYPLNARRKQPTRRVRLKALCAHTPHLHNASP